MATIVGTAGDDSLTGTLGDDLVSGLDGNDTIYGGGGGNDSLYGGAGNDTLEGGPGNDVLDGGSGVNTASYANATGQVFVNLAFEPGPQDTFGAGVDILINIQNVLGSVNDDGLTGNSGNNYLNGGGGNDTLDGGLGDDTLDGGTGINVASYGDAPSAVTVNLSIGTPQNTGGAGVDKLKHIQSLIGSNYNDVLTGDSHSNTLIGGAGDDALYGGGGNDVFSGDPGDDTLDGGTGIDRVDYISATSAVSVSLMITGPQNTLGAGTDTLLNIENLRGSYYYNDTLEGDGGDNVLDGSGGVNTVSYAHATGAVTVTLGVTSPQNTIGAGTDTLSNFQNLTGSAYADTLTGSTKGNVIVGSAGDDTITGGQGADTLTGGAGADHFVYKFASDSTVGPSGQDVITDFSHTDGDKIDISAISPNFVLVAAFAHSAHQLVVLAETGGFLVEGDVNGDGKADFGVFVEGAVAPGPGDFIL